MAYIITVKIAVNGTDTATLIQMMNDYFGEIETALQYNDF